MMKYPQGKRRKVDIALSYLDFQAHSTREALTLRWAHHCHITNIKYTLSDTTTTKNIRNSSVLCCVLSHSKMIVFKLFF